MEPGVDWLCSNCAASMTTITPAFYPLMVHDAQGFFWYARFDPKTGELTPCTPHDARVRKRMVKVGSPTGQPRCCRCRHVAHIQTASVYRIHTGSLAM